MKILVTHVEEGPGLFYAQIYNDETMRQLHCLDSMTDAINKVSNYRIAKILLHTLKTLCT